MTSQKNDIQLIGDSAPLTLSVSRDVLQLATTMTTEAPSLERGLARDTQASLSLLAGDSLLAHLPVALLILNQTGHVVYCNHMANHLLDYELLGQSWAHIVAEKFETQQDQLGRTQLKTGEMIHLSTQAIMNQPGQMIILTDVTKDAQLEAQLEQMQRLSAMGQMAASLAHQIRTPLAAALLYANHLSEESLPTDKRQKFASKTISRLKHIESQISEMLAFVKGSATQFTQISLTDLIMAIEQAGEGIVENHPMRLTLPSDLPNILIQCHQDVLVSAIENCMMNAVEAASPPAEITIKSELVSNQRINLIISDLSGGIPEHLQQKVLQPFFTTRSQGTGLGLAIAKLVCETHGGELWIKSTPGVGSDIGFQLPYIQGEVQ